MQKTIAFIGGGNIASSVIAGLIKAGNAPDNIWVSNPSQEKLDLLQAQHAINISRDNAEVANHANILVLAVKPQIIAPVSEQLANIAQQRKQTVLSLAAGVQVPTLKKYFGEAIPIIRAMPNVAALVGSAATGLYADKTTSEVAKNSAETIMRSIGVTVWVDQEAQMDVVTALSGSGPAYFFLFIKSLSEAAVSQGLSPESARLLAIQTALGAAHVALESNSELQTLINSVTSPGGTTERALESLTENNIQSTLSSALYAAHSRAQEIAKTLAES